MLNDSAVGASYALAQRLADRGERLGVIDGTPMASLLNACFVDVPRDEGDTELQAPYVINSRRVDERGVCEHDLVMEEAANVIAETVTKNLDWARDIVVPTIDEVLAGVDKYVSDRIGGLSDAVRVEPQFWPRIWDNPMLSEMVAPYADRVAAEYLPTRPIFPRAETTEDSVKVMLTGIGSIDADVEALASEMNGGSSNDLTRYIYNKVFSTEQGAENEALVSNSIGNANTRLVEFLMARNLFMSMPEGMADESSYRAQMGEVMATLGRVVHRALVDRGVMEKSKRLGVIYPAGPSEDPSCPSIIYVDGDVYTKYFLEEGGSPEVLMGAMVTDREIKIEALLAQADRYVKAWGNEQRMVAMRVENNKLDVVRQAFIFVLRETAAKIPDELEPLDVEVQYKRIEGAVSTLAGRDMDNLYITARHLVCTLFFPHTMAYKLLLAFDDARRVSPDMEARDCALLAAIDILVDWVAPQITIDKA